MASEAQQRAIANHAWRLKKAGYRRVSIWLSPESLKVLRKSARVASTTEAINQAIVSFGREK